MPISFPLRSCRHFSNLFSLAILLTAASLPFQMAAQSDSANTLAAPSPSTDNFGQNLDQDQQVPDARQRSGYGSRNGEFRGNAASQWDRTVADAYQMGMRSTRFGGGRPEDLESLFEMASKMSGDLSKDVGSNSAIGKALSVLPKLNQIERNGLKLPVGSSAGKFQFAYHDQIGPNGNAMGGGIGRGSAQATYSTGGLKDDMLHFSASAMFGGSGGMGAGGVSGMGGSSLSGGAFSSGGGANGMFSMGGMGGTGLGSGSNSFSTGGMHGAGMGFGGDAGGMHGAGGGHGKGGAENGPAVSLKLTFK